MKQRIFALLLVVALLVTAAVVMVNAEQTETAAATATSEICPHCQIPFSEITEWKNFDFSENATDKNVDLDDGHYRLTGDADVTKQFRPANCNIVIDLNGKNITTSSRFVLAGGSGSGAGAATVTVIDTVGGATVTSTTTMGGGCFYAASGSTVNAYGGTYYGSDYGSSGGAIYAIGTVNIYAPSIVYGSNVTTQGGVAYVAKGTLNVHGGTLVDGNGPKASGIAVSNAAASKVNISGGTVGTVTPLGSSCTVEVSGAPTVAKVDLPTGAKLTVGTLAEGADIKVEAPSGVISAANANISTYVEAGYISLTELAVNGGKSLAVADNQLKVLTTNDVANEMDFSDATNLPTTCPHCGDGVAVTWQELPLATKNGHVLEAGHYYVAGEYTQTNAYRFNVTGSVCLHLNGQNVTMSGNERIIFGSGKDSTITIMGDGVMTGNWNSTTSVVRGSIVDSEGSVNLYGGTYHGTSLIPMIAARGSGDKELNIYEGVTIERLTTEGAVEGSCVTVAGKTTLNMYGGVIRNGKSQTANKYQRGGNIYCYSNSAAGKLEVNIYGGLIENGYADVVGGNIGTWRSSSTTVCPIDINIYGGEIKNGTANLTRTSEGSYGGNIALQIGANLNVYGGTISGGKANVYGGSIYVGSNSTLTMTGGTISGGENIRTSGGNIYATGATISISGGSISGGKATTYGGNIYAVASEITVTGGEIDGGSAGTYGGNISIARATLDLNGGVIQNGTSVTNGANIYVTGGTVSGESVYSTLNVNGAVITAGTASGSGGNIYAVSGNTLNISSGLIQNGKATGLGGNIYGSNINVTGGKIADGEAESSGGNIYQYGAEMTISGGSITGGNSGAYGGNIFVNGGATANIGSATISGGAATSGGRNIYLADDSIATVSGTHAAKTDLIYAGATTLTLENFTVTDNPAEVTTWVVNVSRGELILKGDTNVDNNGSGGNVYVGQSGDLTVDGSFSGSVRVSMAGNHVPDPYYGGELLQNEETAYDQCTGAFTGTLILDDYRSVGHIYGAPKITGNYDASAETPDTKLYVQGDVMLLVDKVTKAVQLFESVDAMLEAYVPAEHYIKVGGSDMTVDLPEGEHHIIDTNGYPVTVTCTAGEATVSGLDSSNATTLDSKAGALVAGAGVTVTDEVKHEAVDGKTYYMLNADGTNTYTYHYVTLKLKSVSLRTSDVGIYYTAEVKADSRFRNAVEEYGVVVRLDNAPTVDFATEPLTGWSRFEGPMVSGNVYGTMVKGIMKTAEQAEGRTAEQNKENAERAIHAAAYITLKDTYGGDVVLSDTVARSLKQVVEAVDGIYADCTDTQKESLLAFYETWKDVISVDHTVDGTEYSAWNVPTIAAAYETSIETESETDTGSETA